MATHGASKDNGNGKPETASNEPRTKQKKRARNKEAAEEGNADEEREKEEEDAEEEEDDRSPCCAPGSAPVHGSGCRVAGGTAPKGYRQGKGKDKG